MHMMTNEWKECHQTIGHIFASGDDSDIEDGVKLDRYWKGDVMFANS